jgi:predicted ATPase/class 3 adenylate cyclase
LTATSARRLMAILAADAAGFSQRMAEDDLATVAALDAARATFRERIGAHGGRVVDTAGDSVLAVFVSAQEAIAAALAAQGELADAAAGAEAKQPLRFRIGVHLGDVIEKPDGTVYGDGVNVAARLQALAAPGGIVASQALLDVVRLRAGVPVTDLGEQAVKNIDRPVHAFAVGHLVAPPAGTGPARSGRGALPPAPPSLVGRDDDLGELQRALSESRIVTILGPGGIGKTALALTAAQRAGADRTDAVAWVDLAPISVPSLLASTIGQTLGVAVAGRDPLAALVRGLAARQALLVLDNAEHLADAVAELVSALARGAPQLRLVVTSQTALHVEGEWLFRLGTLAVPQVTMPADAALRHGAVALFAAQARAADRGFAVTDANVDAVVELCRRLDGVALAIKLAAARLPLLGLAGLLARLSERFRLLAGGSRDAPSRQQTLRAALDWSHGLLSPHEQAVFRRLGVFAGHFDLELAAHAVADDGQDPWAAVDTIAALVDRSLVVVEPGEVRRCRLLESAREYALLQLDAAGERSAAHARVADAMLAHAPDLVRQQPQTLAHHLCEGGRPTEAVPYWAQAAATAGARSGYVEAAHHLTRACALLREAAAADAGQAAALKRTELPLLVKLGNLHMLTRGTGSAEAEADFRRALALADEVGTLAERFIATFNLWFVSEAQLKFDVAGLYIEDTQRLAFESGDPRLVLQAHHARYTTSLLLGDFGQALQAVDAGYKLYRPVDAGYHCDNFVGHDPGICALGARTFAAFALGDVDAAYDSAERTLRAARASEHVASRIVGHYATCGMFVIARDAESLRGPADEALAACRKLSLTQYEGLFLVLCSWVAAVADRDPAAADAALRGVQLFGSTGTRLRVPVMRTIAAEACLAVGRVDDAQAAVERALDEIAAHGEGGIKSMALAVHAGVLRVRGLKAEAQARYLEAIEVARTQQARGLALRAANGLAALWLAHGERGRVRALLQPLLESFASARRETRDLAEARAMIDA